MSTPAVSIKDLVEKGLMEMEAKGLESTKAASLAELLSRAGLSVAGSLPGAVAGVVARELFDALFGDDVDIEDAIRNAVEQIAAIVREAIDANELRSLNIQTRGLARKLKNYSRSGALDQLEDATEDAEDAVQGLMEFWLRGHHGFLTAAALYHACYLARIGSSLPANAEGERANLLDALDTHIAHANRCVRMWRAWHKKRYMLRFQAYPRSAIGVVYIPLRDGHQIVGPNNSYIRWGDRIKKEEAEARLEEITKADWKREIYPMYVKPSDDVVTEWKALKEVLSRP
jgi:hypothetical protein